MKLESTVKTIAKVTEVKEKMVKKSEEFGMDSDDITNTELSWITALLSDIAMSLAIIADHYTDLKKGN